VNDEHVTRNEPTSFEVQRSKVKVTEPQYADKKCAGTITIFNICGYNLKNPHVNAFGPKLTGPKQTSDYMPG